MATAYHMEALRRQRILERAVEARERMQEQEAASARAEEEKRAKEKRKQHRHHHHKRSNRPASAQKITSSPKKSKTAHSPSPPVSEKADKMETSPPPPAPAEAGKANHSKKSSRCSTASESVNGQQSDSRPISSTSLHSSNKPQAKGSCHDSITTTAEQSRACSSNREVVSETETITVSRCSKCRSVISSTSSQPHVHEQSRSASRSSVGGGRVSSRSVTSVRSESTRVSSTLGSERGLEKRAKLKAEAVRKDLHQQELVLRDSNLVMGNIPVNEEMKLRALEQQKLD